MTGKGRLCNQGCGTRIFFQIDKKSGKNRPYNVYDEEKHVCPMMEMAKMYGGKWNTIPMDTIKKQIIESRNAAYEASEYRVIDQIIKALKTILDNLKFVVAKMEVQEAENTGQANKLDAYKKKLVEDQYRRAKEEEQQDGL